MTLPLRSPAPAGAITLNICNDATRDCCVAERYQYLVQHHLVHDGVPCMTKSERETLCQPAISLTGSLRAKRGASLPRATDRSMSKLYFPPRSTGSSLKGDP